MLIILKVLVRSIVFHTIYLATNRTLTENLSSLMAYRPECVPVN